MATTVDLPVGAWVVPAGVSLVDGLAIGGGAAGSTVSALLGLGGGGGGASSRDTGIVTVPGETLTVALSVAGIASLSRGATVLLSANPGTQGAGATAGLGGTTATGVGVTKYAGGDGSAGTGSGVSAAGGTGGGGAGLLGAGSSGAAGGGGNSPGGYGGSGFLKGLNNGVDPPEPDNPAVDGAAPGGAGGGGASSTKPSAAGSTGLLRVTYTAALITARPRRCARVF